MANKITKLNEFQKEFIKWARDKKRILNVALPGQGKTISSTAFYLYLKKTKPDLKMVVFTKTKAMVAFEKANLAHWQITKLTNGDSLKQFYSMTEFYSDIYMINPSLLPKLSKQPASVKKHFFSLISQCNLLVIDEVHNYRSYSSSVTQCLRKITDWYQRYVDSDSAGWHRIILLDATPKYKNLESWHSVFALLEPRLFGNYFNFLDRYCVLQQRNAYVGQRVYSANGTSRVKKSITFNEIIGYKNEDELNQRMAPYIFSWNKTDFTVSYNLHTYKLTPSEQEKYQVALKGLGLDKEYRIVIQDANGTQTSLYRDKHDTFYTPDRKDTIEVLELTPGKQINFNAKRQVIVSILDKKKDASYATRMIKLQQTISGAEEKLDDLLRQVKNCANGCLIYCTYHSTVQAVYQKLVSASLGRRIVILTGETKNFDQIVRTLTGAEIVIGTRVIGESLDFYSDNFILYEVLSIGGAFSQAIGRLTRTNSPFRDLNVSIYLRPNTIEEYLYCRLQRSLKDDPSPYVKNMPESPSLKGVDPAIVDLTYLKEHFLWNKN